MTAPCKECQTTGGYIPPRLRAARKVGSGTPRLKGLCWTCYYRNYMRGVYQRARAARQQEGVVTA